MAGAQGPGDIVARAEAARAAGCDMVLVCNDPAAADTLLSRWRPAPQPDLALRCSRMACAAALRDRPNPRERDARDDPA
jgi:beta-N-acetylhexosaminidase